MIEGLLLSDIHSGSVWSPAVPRARTDYNGGTIGLNPLQKNILLPRWKQMCAGGPYDFVVVNGDLVDGLNRKSKGMGVWTHSMDLQAENCAKLLNMVEVKPEAPIFILGGTPYHVDENPGIDQVVAEKLGALGKKVKYCGYEHTLDLYGQRFHFSHWVADAVYDGTTLAKEILMSKKHDIEVTGMIRGHRHHYGIFSDGFRFAAILPAWKGRDDYVGSKGMRYATTQIGWVVLKVTQDDWDMKPTLWNLKNQIPVTKIAQKTETF